MSLEFNCITIRSADDLREAMLVETSQEEFVERMCHFEKIWGREVVFDMLYDALYKSTGRGCNLPPIIKPTHKLLSLYNEEPFIVEIED